MVSRGRENRMKDLNEVKKLSQEAYDFLTTKDLTTVEVGRYDLANGVFIKVQEYQSKLYDNAKFEAHKKYIDIQYIVSGEELMYEISVDEIQEKGLLAEYNPEKDVLFYHDDDRARKNLIRAGEFMIFTPQDAHKPGVAVSEPSQVKKVLVKIPVK